MVRIFTIALLSMIAAASSAVACLEDAYKVGKVVMKSDGTVARITYVLQKRDSQNGTTAQVYVPVERDRVLLESGDQIMLNADPQMQDAILQVVVHVKSQDRDDQGIFSTTYLVKEIMTPTFGGLGQDPIEKTFLITVKSNYLGKGTYAKGCGGVEKVQVETSAKSKSL
jgi:hypothetical protein